MYIYIYIHINIYDTHNAPSQAADASLFIPSKLL